jgi:hypothetical protein
MSNETKENINLDEKLEEGYILVKAIIEMLGKPKEHIEETLKSYIDKLDEADNYIVVSEEYSEAEEKESMFSMFVEVELLVKGTEQLAWFCFDYLPSSIEVVEPSSLKYKSNDFTNFLNDLIGRLHQLDMTFKNSGATIQKLNANAEALMKNFLGYIIREEAKSPAEIGKVMGIPEENMKQLLNRLHGEKYVKKDGDNYIIAISPKE